MNLSFLSGMKAYVAAIGLVGLAVYQLSNGDFVNALQSFAAAMATFGVQSAIVRNQQVLVENQQEMLKQQVLLQTQQSHLLGLQQPKKEA